MDRLLRPLEDLESTLFSSLARSFDTSTDIFEKEGNLIVRTELPGVRKEDLSINATKHTLNIKGRRECVSDDPKVKFWTMQRDCGSFTNSISLPVDIDPDNISAKLENGLLVVTAKIPPSSVLGSAVNIS